MRVQNTHVFADTTLDENRTKVTSFRIKRRIKRAEKFKEAQLRAKGKLLTNKHRTQEKWFSFPRSGAYAFNT